MKVKAIPAGFHSLNTDLIVNDVEKAIDFYVTALGAKKSRIFRGPDSSIMHGIMHAELKIGDSVLMLSPEFPQMKVLSPLSPGGGTSASLFLYVEDVDSVFEKAVSAGATVTMPLTDTFWGDRAGGFTDPSGHRWTVATHIKDLSIEEIEEASKAMFAGHS